MPEPLTICVLDGDETSQELLEQGLRALAPDVIGVPLARTLRPLPRTAAGDREQGPHGRRDALRASGFGVKAATITPEGKDDVGSPSWLEELDTAAGRYPAVAYRSLLIDATPG
jgi:isocitrate dehydrogenase (NAD+)